MAEFIKPYNEDPFVGNLSTPINSSNVTKIFLINLPAYRIGLSSLLRGLEVGMAHGYFLLGPFYILGPLRNSEVALLSGFLSVVGLILILTAALSIYSLVFSDTTTDSNSLQTAEGWRRFTSGFLVGAIGGAGFAYLLLLNFG
jgi:photosystem I subunit 11|tara:strand:- start:14899 stop:15327 length:429 start_codon:yes stop_codon:yes gene_type:complete